MPIRNFYIDCEIDGHKGRLTGGLRVKDSGFRLTIYQRSDDCKIVAVKVCGSVRDDGQLCLDVLIHDDAIPIHYNRKRILTNR